MTLKIVSGESQQQQEKNLKKPATDGLVSGNPPSTVIPTKKITEAAINKVKSVRYTPATIRETNRSTMESNRIVRDRSINADIDIEPEILAFLYSYVQEEPDTEINGFGHVDEDNRLDWASIVSIGTAGAVTSTQSDMAWAVNECVKAIKDVPNMQLHTHPGFDTFFSTVDTSDIVQYVEETRNGLDVEYGHMYFMVFNMEAWLVRKVEWCPQGAFYNDGLVFGHNIAFANTTKKTSYFGGYTTKINKNNDKPKETKPIADNKYKWDGRGLGSMTRDDWQDTQDFVTYQGNKIIVPPDKSSGSIAEIGANATPSVKIPWRKPLKNDYAITDLITAHEKNEKLLPEVKSLSFLDFWEIRSFLNNRDKKEVWDALAKEMYDARGEQEPSKTEIDSMYEMITKSYGQGNIADAAIVLDLCDWFTGIEVLKKMKKENEALHSILTRSEGGYSFGTILVMISENFSICRKESDAQEANTEIISKLPTKIGDEFADYLTDAWENNEFSDDNTAIVYWV